jgi:cytidine kinase
MKTYPLSAKYTMIVGSVAIDRVATANAQSDNILGGAASYASIASSYFAPTRLVGVVGKDFPDNFVQEYRKHHIDLDGLQVDPEGKTFFWSGKYSEYFESRETLELQLNVFEKFSPTLQGAYRSSSFVMLGAIQPSLQLHVMDQLFLRPRKPFVLADTFDHWILSAREDFNKVMRRVDMVVINEEEALLLTKERNLAIAGPMLRKMGPKIVVVKRGANGAVLFHPAGFFTIPAYPTAKLVDPTGAGDSFAGALVGYLAAVNRTDFAALKKAMAYATAVASLTVESFSVDRLSSAGRDTIDLRYRALINITRF